MRLILAVFGVSLLSACATPTPAPTAFPEGLKVMAEGYPYPGGPCRLLGETFATSELLDDSADLLGCPPDAMQDPRVSGVGRVVGAYQGIVILSAPKSATH